MGRVQFKKAWQLALETVSIEIPHENLRVPRGDNHDSCSFWLLKRWREEV